MKEEQTSKAKQSRTAIIWGCVLGILGLLWLFIVGAFIGLGVTRAIIENILLLLPVLLPIGLLVFGLVKGLQANQEIRQDLETTKKYQVASLVIAMLILIALFVMVFEITNLVAVCLQTPLQCSYY